MGLGHRPALAELITELPATVSVVRSPPAPGDVLTMADGGLGPLGASDAEAYINDLVALLGIVIE